MFSRNEFKNYLIQFDLIYKKKPIKNNDGGGKYPQLFGLFCILKKIKPDVVIESGVYKGQSTYIIKQALPNAKIISLDTNLSQREYVNKSVIYKEKDFKYLQHNFSKSKTLVFFDDHQNFMDRCMQAFFFGYQHIIFEDNYRVGEGDCYTLEHAKKRNGFYQEKTIKNFLRSLIRINSYLIKKYIFKQDVILDFYSSGIRDVDKENYDYDNLFQNIKKIYTFPPVYAPSICKKNTIKSIIKNPLLFPTAYQEKENYNFLTYINFNNQKKSK